MSYLASQGKWLPYSFEYLYHSLIPQTISGKNVKNKARVNIIYGNSVVENQLAIIPTIQTQTTNGITLTNNGDGSITIQGTASADTIFDLSGNLSRDVPLGHYVFITNFSNPSNTTYYLYDAYESGITSTYTNQANGYIKQKAGSSTIISPRVYVKNGAVISTPQTVFIQYVDLTQKYPFDTPTSLTDNRIIAYLNEGYHAFNSGTIKDSILGEIGSAGFNIWDEEWEQGYINANGVPASASRLRSKNFIKVVGGKEYCYYCSVLVNFNVFFYDNNYNFISSTTKTNSASNRTATITTPNNVSYIKFYLSSEYGDGTTYNNDICINVSSSLNGTYKPHTQPQKISLPAPIQNAGVGTAKNKFEITSSAYVFTRNVWEVDLGALSYGYDSGAPFFTCDDLVGKIKAPLSTSAIVNALSNLYIPISYDTYVNTTNKNMTLYCSTAGKLRITNTAYTDPTIFKTAMSGVMLEYQLATPQVITIPRKHLGVVFIDKLTNVGRSNNGGAWNNYLFYAQISDLASATTNIYCNSFLNTTSPISSVDNKTIRTASNYIYIRDDSCTTTAQLLEKYAGVPIFYETENEVADIFDTIDIEAGGTITSNWFSWVENQQVTNGNFVSTSSWSAFGGTLSANNNVGTLTITNTGSANRIQQDIYPTANHKYCVWFDVKSNKATGVYIHYGQDYTSMAESIQANTTTRINWLISPNTATNPFRLYVNYGGTYLQNGDTIDVSNINIVDLTTGFGAGKEPTSINDPRIQEIIRLGYIPTNTTGTLKHIDPIVLPNADMKLKSK